MDYKFWISIYAAVISTVVFIWRLYEFYYDRIGKLSINIRLVSRTNIYNTGDIGQTESFLIVDIVNIGKNKRFIEKPIFQSDINFEGQKYLNLCRTDIIKKFPICLEPGEKFEFDLPFDKFGQELKKARVTKIKGIIYDTHKKSYCSTWFKL